MPARGRRGARAVLPGVQAGLVQPAPAHGCRSGFQRDGRTRRQPRLPRLRPRSAARRDALPRARRAARAIHDLSPDRRLVVRRAGTARRVPQVVGFDAALPVQSLDAEVEPRPDAPLADTCVHRLGERARRPSLRRRPRLALPRVASRRHPRRRSGRRARLDSAPVRLEEADPARSSVAQAQSWRVVGFSGPRAASPLWETYTRELDALFAKHGYRWRIRTMRR